MDINYILNNLPKQPVHRDDMVHIDDMVTVARVLRRDGFTVVRRQDYAGMKTSIFDVYSKNEHGALYTFSLYVDIWRSMPRGIVIIMPETNGYIDVNSVELNAGIELPDYILRTRFNK